MFSSPMIISPGGFRFKQPLILASILVDSMWRFRSSSLCYARRGI